jgi:hypothetical protein
MNYATASTAKIKKVRSLSTQPTARQLTTIRAGWDESPKEKKMNFLQRWLVNIGKRAYEKETDEKYASDLVETTPRIEGNPLRLNIYRANGGTIVEATQYDQIKDRNFTQLHIVTHDQDLGQSLGKIITMEALRG